MFAPNKVIQLWSWMHEQIAYCVDVEEHWKFGTVSQTCKFINFSDASETLRFRGSSWKLASFHEHPRILNLHGFESHGHV